MAKHDPSAPVIFLAREGEAGDVLRCMVIAPGFGSKIVRLRNYNAVSSLSLEVEGFDEMQVDGVLRSLPGRVFLRVEMESGDPRVFKIAEYNAPITVNNGSRFTASEILDKRKQIEGQWQSAFKDALIAVSESASTAQDNLAPVSKPRTKPVLSALTPTTKKDWVIRGVFCVCALVFIFASIKMFAVSSELKKQGATSTVALADEHEDAMAKVYEDLGIDRSKLTNDLSCFSE